MRFFIGALALLVICAIFASPAVLLLGWSPLTASDRQIVGTIAKRTAHLLPSRRRANSVERRRAKSASSWSPRRSLCKSPLHESLGPLAAPAFLSPRQPQRGAARGGAQADRAIWAGGLQPDRGGAACRRQPRRALSPFPRPRRAARRGRTLGLRALRRAARHGVEQRHPHAAVGLRAISARPISPSRATSRRATP